MDRDERRADLLDALDGVVLTEADRRLVDWLSQFDQDTTEAVAALLHRVRAAKAPRWA